MPSESDAHFAQYTQSWSPYLLAPGQTSPHTTSSASLQQLGLETPSIEVYPVAGLGSSLSRCMHIHSQMGLPVKLQFRQLVPLLAKAICGLNSRDTLIPPSRPYVPLASSSSLVLATVIHWQRTHLPPHAGTADTWASRPWSTPTTGTQTLPTQAHSPGTSAPRETVRNGV